MNPLLRFPPDLASEIHVLLEEVGADVVNAGNRVNLVSHHHRPFGNNQDQQDPEEEQYQEACGRVAGHCRNQHSQAEESEHVEDVSKYN